jgi:hypothetical protein
MNWRNLELISTALVASLLSSITNGSADPGGPERPASSSKSVKDGTQQHPEDVVWLPATTTEPFWSDSKPTEYRDLALGPTGTVWVATSEGIIQLNDQTEESRVREEGGMGVNPAFELASTSGGIFAATQRGLIWIEEPAAGVKARRLTDVGVQSLFIRGDRLWFLEKGSQQMIRSLALIKGRPAGDPRLEIHVEEDRRFRKILPGGTSHLYCLEPHQEWIEIDTGTQPHRYSTIDPSLEPIDSLSTESALIILTKQGTSPPGGRPGRIAWVRGEGKDGGCLATDPNPAYFWIVEGGKACQAKIDSPSQVQRSIALPKDFKTVAFAIDFHGRLWLLSRNSFVTADPVHSRVLNRQPKPNEIKTERQYDPRLVREEDLHDVAQNVGFSDDGTIWVWGLNQFEPENPSIPGAASGRPEGTVSNVLFGKPAYMFINNKIIKYESGRWASLMPAGISSNPANRLLDSMGNLLVLKDYTDSGNGSQIAVINASNDSSTPLMLPFRHVSGSVDLVVPSPSTGETWALRNSREYYARENYSIIRFNKDGHTENIDNFPQDPPFSSSSPEFLAPTPPPPPGLLRMDSGSVSSNSNPAGSILSHVVHLVDPETGQVDLVEGRRTIRRRKSEGRWTEHYKGMIKNPSSSTRVLGMVSDPWDQSLIVGTEGFDPGNLFQIDGHGTTRSLERGSVMFEVAATGGSLFIDRRDRLWAFTTNGLLCREKRGMPFASVFAPVGTDIPKPPRVPTRNDKPGFDAILEDAGGRIWVAGKTVYEQGVWMIEAGQSPRLVFPSRAAITSLALFETLDSPDNRLWFSGPGILGSLALAGNNLKIEDHGKDLEGAYEMFTARDETTGNRPPLLLARSGGDLLVLGRPGLIKIDGRSRQIISSRISLEGWPKAEEMSNFSYRILPLKSRGFFVSLIGAGSKCLIWWYREDQKISVPLKISGEVIWSALETPAGEILLGGENGQVYQLRDDLTLATRLSVSPPEARAPFTSVGGAGESELLVRDADGMVFRISLSGEATRLNVVLRPWIRCSPLGGEKRSVLMIHEDGGLTRLDLANSTATKVALASSKRRLPDSALEFAQLIRPPKESGRRSVWILTSGGIWYYPPDSAEPVQIADLPPEDRLARSGFSSLSVDNEGFWVGTTGHGLWRIMGDPRRRVLDDPSSRWDLWEEFDGLPSPHILGVVPISTHQALVWTKNGSCVFRRRAGDKVWSIDDARVNGISSAQVKVAKLFRLGGEVILAVGSDRGLDLAQLTIDGTKIQKWYHLDFDSNEYWNSVAFIHWSEDVRELCVKARSDIYRIPFRETWSESPIYANEIKRVPSFGDDVSAIDHKNDLIIFVNKDRYSYRGNICLISRKNADNVVYLHSSIIANKAILVPPSQDSGTRILVSERLGEWSVHDLTHVVNFELESVDYFFAWTGRIKPQALDRARMDLSRWRVRYAIGRGMDELQCWPWFLPRDLFDLGPDEPDRSDRNPSTFLIAELRPLVPHPLAPEERYVITTPINRSSQFERVARVILLALLIAGLLAWLASSILFSFRRSSRIRRREIPYIAGEAIGPNSDQTAARPKTFIGREETLSGLRDRVATTSQALVGRFRIGKTSIQLQFAHQIERLDDATYHFFPEFIDLQILGARHENFFHFLGMHLLKLAERHEVPPEVLTRMRIKDVVEGEEYLYSGFSFEADLKALLEHWEKTLAPRLPLIVLLIDEITLLGKIDYDILLQFRYMFVRYPLLKTVMSGRKILKNRDQPDLSPWWNFIGKVTEVEPLTPHDARRLLVEPVHGLFEYRQDAIEVILARGEGKPFQIQKIGIAVLNYMYRQKRVRRKITLADVRAALEAVGDDDPKDDLPSEEEA